MKNLIVTLFSLLVIATAFAQDKSGKPLNETNEMKIYYLVFLKKGPNRNQDSTTAAKIQKEHLMFLTKMYNEGHADIIGPLMDDIDIRGIAVYNTKTADEARQLAEGDPAVKAGRIVIEVHPWYTLKGGVLR